MTEESKSPILKIKEAEERAKKAIEKKQKQLEQNLESRILTWENKKQKLLAAFKKEEEGLPEVLQDNFKEIELTLASQYEKELSLLKEKSKKNFDLLYQQLLKQIFEGNYDSKNQKI